MNGGGGGREVLGPPQVAFAALSLGRFDRGTEMPGPSLVSASGFSSFIFLGGVSFAFRGDQGWRPPHHAVGHPTSRPPALPTPPPRSPAPTSRTERFRWAKVGLRRAAGAARTGESVRESQPLGLGGAVSPSRCFLKPPGPSFGGNITPRAMFGDRAVLWMACAF